MVSVALIFIYFSEELVLSKMSQSEKGEKPEEKNYYEKFDPTMPQKRFDKIYGNVFEEERVKRNKRDAVDKDRQMRELRRANKANKTNASKAKVRPSTKKGTTSLNSIYFLSFSQKLAKSEKFLP